MENRIRFVNEKPYFEFFIMMILPAKRPGTLRSVLLEGQRLEWALILELLGPMMAFRGTGGGKGKGLRT